MSDTPTCAEASQTRLRSRCYVLVGVAVLGLASTVVVAPPVLANNCAIPPDVLRSASTAFVATIEEASFDGDSNLVEYQLDDVQPNSPQPDDLVVVAFPNNGVIGASFRVGQSYWFAPDEIEGSRAHLEVCKFGLSGERPALPPLFVPSDDNELELMINPDEPFANIESLFTATIESAVLVDGEVAEYTVRDVSMFAGSVDDDIGIRTQISDGVFTVGERAWFAISTSNNIDGRAIAELTEPEFGTANSLDAMYEGFGIDPSDDLASITTVPELSLEPVDLTAETTTTTVETSSNGLLVVLGMLGIVIFGSAAFWRQRTRWE